MNPLPLLLFLLSTSLQSFASPCVRAEDEGASPTSLSVVASSLDVASEEGRRMVTTLGTLKNSSLTCFDSVVVEIKYFDAKNNHIDTVTQPLYGIVAPPSQSVEFRIRDAAAKGKEEYSTQSLRVVSAEPRVARGPRPTSSSPSSSNTFLELLISWGPMLLLIGVWIFFMQRMKRKDSPQVRNMLLFEQQNATLEAQNRLLERIATAAEGHAAKSNGT